MDLEETSRVTIRAMDVPQRLERGGVSVNYDEQIKGMIDVQDSKHKDRG